MKIYQIPYKIVKNNLEHHHKMILKALLTETFKTQLQVDTISYKMNIYIYFFFTNHFKSYFSSTHINLNAYG